MTKIEYINLRNFSNREHNQFMTDFSELISTYHSSIMGMEVLYGIFQNTLMAEDLALRVEEGSSISKTLEYLDQLRDKTWNAIHLRVKATLLSPLEEEVQSAQTIEKIIHRYGDVRALTYSEQSSALVNLTNDLLLTENEKHIDRMGFPAWVIELKSRNEQFMAVYDNRKSEFSGRESGKVKAVRTLIDPVYEQLVERINATLVLEFAQPETIILAGMLNEKIKQFTTSPVTFNRQSMVEERKDE